MTGYYFQKLLCGILIMNWKRIVENPPPPNKKLLIAWGYIFDRVNYNIIGYSVKTFEKYELMNMKLSDNNRYCFHNGTGIAFWREIISPTEELIESYGELIRTLNCISNNNKDILLKCDIKCLEKAKIILSKFAQRDAQLERSLHKNSNLNVPNRLIK